jgi:hypothetical protein
MSGLRLYIVLLVAALLLVNANCLAACAAQPQEQAKVPPCHKQNGGCHHVPVVVDYQGPAKSPAVHAPPADSLMTPSALVIRLFTPATSPAPGIESPPRSPDLTPYIPIRI